MTDRKRREWPLWLQVLSLITFGWAITFGAIYAVSYGIMGHRGEGFIFGGPLATVGAVVWVVSRALDRRKQR